MTTVTAVTAFLRAGAVSETSSRSSRLSRGAGSNVKGAYLRVEIAARQYNPYPLTFGPRRTLAGWWERLCLSHLPNGEWQSLGGVQGALFKGQPCWGSRPQTAGAAPLRSWQSSRHEPAVKQLRQPLPFRGAKHFHTAAPMGWRCESAFVLLSHQKVTKRLFLAEIYDKIEDGRISGKGAILWELRFRV